MDDEAQEYDVDLMLGREYSDLSRIFRYIVVTGERTYLCNDVTVDPTDKGSETFFRVVLYDAWVWDAYLPTRFLDKAEVYTFSDVNIEEVKRDIE